MPRAERWLQYSVVALAVAALLGPGSARADAEEAEGGLRLLVIGAHPDDPDKSGGTMARYVQLGHTVKFVSLTNGDAGHQSIGGGPLALIRTAEAKCAGEVIDSEYITLDNHDGELMPTLEVRRQVIRVIREFKPDMVFTPRVDDYHPDHRATGQLVRDAAYMVTVPNIVAKTPHLEKNPIFVNVEDRFSRPSPFDPVIVVDVGDVVEKKVDMYHCHTSQMYEWLPYNRGNLDEVPEGDAERRAWLAEQLKARWRRTADRFRDKLIELYGEEKGSKVEFAEAFEISEYGYMPPMEELKKLFPFF
jgi:LmbE family N-acetylglucosaminyl deacetylase